MEKFVRERIEEQYVEAACALCERLSILPQDFPYLTEKDVEDLTNDNDERAILSILTDIERPVAKASDIPLECILPQRRPEAVPTRPNKVRRLVERAGKAPEENPEQQQQAALTRKLQAAEAVVSILTTHLEATQHSEHLKDLALKGDEAVSEWIDAFRDQLASRFETGTLRSARSRWFHLQSWLHSSGTHSAFPRDVELRKYLLCISVKGPTVAPSAWASFEWLRRHLGLPLPMESPLVLEFAKAVNHEQKQVPALALQAWKRLATTACGSSPFKWAAALILRVIVMALRHAHVRRATMTEASPGRQTWRISKGKSKDRGAYSISMPTSTQPTSALFSELHDEMVKQLGTEAATTVMLPDITILKDNVVIQPRHCSYHKFSQALKVLSEDSYENSPESSVSSYAARRFLPSVAAALKLSEEERDALGAWAGKLPQRCRYDENRAQAVAYPRKLCLIALHYILHDNPKIEWPDLILDSDLLGEVKKAATTPAWIATGAKATVVNVPSVHDQGDKADGGADEQKGSSPSDESSASSSSSSDSETDDDDSADGGIDEELAKGFAWARPKRGMLHVLNVEAGDRIPKCRNIQLADTCTIGSGIDEAMATSARWCPLCVSKADDGIIAVINKAYDCNRDKSK